VVEALLTRFDDDGLDTRYAAAWALYGHDSPKVIQAMLSGLYDRAANIRYAAIQVLAGHESPKVIAGLIARLDDPEPHVRSAAAQALEEWPSPNALLAFAMRYPQGSFFNQTELSNLAEQLMIRFYTRIKPEQQEAIRAVMARFSDA
jgi:HEAT repeats